MVDVDMDVSSSSGAEIEEDEISSDEEEEEEIELSSSENDSAGEEEDGGEGESSGNDQEEEEQEGDDEEQEEGGDDDSSDEEQDEADQGEDLEEEDENDPKEEISGWADSIAKILKSTKPKNKKELMLSRARKDYEVNQAVEARKKVGGSGDKSNKARRRQQDDDLEIIPLDNKPKVEGGDDEAIDKTKKKDAKIAAAKKKDDKLLSLKVQRKLELKQKKLELAWENLARMQAEKTDPQLERDLVKMATKGVVQLFNAISMQQKTIKSKLRTSEKSEFKKDKVLHQTKDIFDNAMSKSKRLGNSAETEAQVKKEEVSSSDDEEIDDDDDDVEEIVGGATVSIKINNKRKATTPIISNSDKNQTSKKKPVWNALQDDFMLDAKLKDWDKDSDDSN